jgi:hypothetical protein
MVAPVWLNGMPVRVGDITPKIIKTVVSVIAEHFKIYTNLIAKIVHDGV